MREDGWALVCLFLSGFNSAHRLTASHCDAKSWTRGGGADAETPNSIARVAPSQLLRIGMAVWPRVVESKLFFKKEYVLQHSARCARIYKTYVTQGLDHRSHKNQ